MCGKIILDKIKNNNIKENIEVLYIIEKVKI